jgi:hypothetical protein
MKYWRKRILRSPKPFEQLADALETEPIARWRNQGQAIELGLHGGGR